MAVEQNVRNVQVYYHRGTEKIRVGLLKGLPDDGSSFTYDPEYLASKHPVAIAHSLPLREASFDDVLGLLPFFDNLLAEGIQKDNQVDILKAQRLDFSDLTRLAYFGKDLSGAVSCGFAGPAQTITHETAGSRPSNSDSQQSDRVSLAGFQPKAGVYRAADGCYLEATEDHPSTHIAKLPTEEFPDIVPLEFLAGCAARVFLGDKRVAEQKIAQFKGQEALIVTRFDRQGSPGNLQRLHFEEFSQLLNYRADEKYESSYQKMLEFMRRTPGCPTPIQLLEQIIVCILLGNGDAHLKNFALFRPEQGFMQMTPAYDLVPTLRYAEPPHNKSKKLAMRLVKEAGQTPLLKSIRYQNLQAMCQKSGLKPQDLDSVLKKLQSRLPEAKEAVLQYRQTTISADICNWLVDMLQKRWNSISP